MQIDVIKYKAVFTSVFCFSDVNMEVYTSGWCVHLKSSPLAWRILDCRRIMFIMRDLYLLPTSLRIVLAFSLESKYVLYPYFVSGAVGLHFVVFVRFVFSEILDNIIRNNDH